MELRESVWYYEGQAQFLGDRFATAVEHAIESILDPSIRWGFYSRRRSVPQIFSRSIAGFPCNVIYLLRDNEIIVVAYAHERRRPGYWKRRLTD